MRTQRVVLLVFCLFGGTLSGSSGRADMVRDFTEEPARPPATVPSPSAAPESGTLTILVQGVASAQGQVTALLYASDDGFPAKEAKAKQRVSVPASVGSVRLRFEHVAPGTYAVTVYHDANGNGKLDSNWIGIPKEPVAVSNNAKGRMGPPKFKDAKFSVESGQKDVQISLIKI